jgi:hypothetical protein
VVKKDHPLDEPLVATYPKWYDDFVLYEAQHGHPDPLAARLIGFLQNGGEPLTKGEVEFVVKTLMATGRKRGKDELRKAERQLIAMQVKGLTKEKKLPLKAAIDEVMRYRRRSKRHVQSALSASKNGKSPEGK